MFHRFFVLLNSFRVAIVFQFIDFCIFVCVIIIEGVDFMKLDRIRNVK